MAPWLSTNKTAASIARGNAERDAEFEKIAKEAKAKEAAKIAKRKKLLAERRRAPPGTLAKMSKDSVQKRDYKTMNKLSKPNDFDDKENVPIKRDNRGRSYRRSFPELFR